MRYAADLLGELAGFAVILTGWLTTAEVQRRKYYVQASVHFCFIASISSLVDAFTPSHSPSQSFFPYLSIFFTSHITA